jgi:hypothetical protein
VKTCPILLNGNTNRKRLPLNSRRHGQIGDQVAYGEFTMFPLALDEALSKRVNELQDVRVTGYVIPPRPRWCWLILKENILS